MTVDDKLLRQEELFREQRAERGWDESAYWDTGSWLAKNLGEVLCYSAERLHGHPEWTTFEEWQSAYHDNGKALLQWHTLRNTYPQSSELAIAAYKAAQEALRWVADNLDAIWD